MLTRLVSTTLAAGLLLCGACGFGVVTGGGDDGDNGGADAGSLPPYIGQILFLELGLNEFPAEGTGLGIAIRFQAREDVVAAVKEDVPNSPFGCKAWDYSREEYLDPGIDIGTLHLALEGGAPVPPCNFIEGIGYRCFGATGSGVEIDRATGDLMELVDPEGAFTADDLGRIIEVTGAESAENNGSFPIAEVVDATTVNFTNAAGSREVPSPAGYSTRVGAPFPSGMTDPIGDETTLSVSLEPGDGTPLAAFSYETLDIGRSFTLDTESQATINSIPTDGSGFRLGCLGDGGACRQAMATVVNITTTDVDAPPPTQFPDPAARAIQLQCLVVSGEAVFSEDYSAYLVGTGATRIRTGVVRAFATQSILDDVDLLIGRGHMVMGYSVP